MSEEKEPLSFLGFPIERFYNTMLKKDGRFSFSKLWFHLALGACLFAYVNWNSLMTMYIEHSKAQSYKEIMLQERLEKEQKLVQVIPSLMSSLREINESDLVVFYKHYPYPERTYIKAMYYNGRFPEGVEQDDLQEIMTDSSKGDYITHMKGIPYNVFGDKPKSYLIDMHFYSCPVYNTNAEYDGKVSIYWKNKPVPWDSELYYTSCMRVSREIGKYLF